MCMQIFAIQYLITKGEMLMNKCFNCGAEFEGKFCPECGAKYEETKICPQCGTELDGQVKFCNECGHSFVKQQPQQTVTASQQHVKQKSQGWANFKHNITTWTKKHKSFVRFLSFVLIVGIVLSVVLPLTVGNIFRANRVAKINIGDDYAQVEKILGKPFAEYSNEYIYRYYSRNMTKKLQQQQKLQQEIENLTSFGDLIELVEKDEKLQAEIDALEYKSITVTFSDGKVTSVVFDKHANNKNTQVKWKNNGGNKQSIELLPDKIPFGSTPKKTDLIAKIFYEDGSYKLAKISGVHEEGDKKSGWTVTWSDNWGEYSYKIYESTDITKDTVIHGEYDGDFTYNLYPLFEGSKFTGNYRMEIVGSGEIPRQDTYIWTKDLENVTELVFANGISNIPSNATKLQGTNGNSILKSVTISDSVTSIDDNAFYSCSSLESITIPSSVTSIGNYAFRFCSRLTSVFFENPNGWWYSISSTATSGTSFSLSDLSNSTTTAQYLTNTYCRYYWKRT